MAKSFMKKAKKAVKSAKKEVKKEVKKVSSSAKDHIESLSKQRRDAAVIWGMIQNGNHSDSDIKKMVEEKGFHTLLGEL
ncbi:pyruvate phosphate dikinase [uncultured Mediterranean phage]|nr:pyruvate phosphate dikinase [uncultured Mediterranean phage]